MDVCPTGIADRSSMRLHLSVPLPRRAISQSVQRPTSAARTAPCAVEAPVSGRLPAGEVPVLSWGAASGRSTCDRDMVTLKSPADAGTGSIDGSFINENYRVHALNLITPENPLTIRCQITCCGGCRTSNRLDQVFTWIYKYWL